MRVVVRGRGGAAARGYQYGGGRGGGGESYAAAASAGRRLAAKRPAQKLLEALTRGKRGLQLVSCSATVDAAVRRQLGLLVGGEGKKAAGVVVSAEPSHPPPAELRKRGVGGVSVPSTLRHTAYVGSSERATLMMLRVAFEEAMPEAPLLVHANGASLPKQVAALKREGFAGAVALHDALGVAAAGGGADAAGTPAAATRRARTPTAAARRARWCGSARRSPTPSRGARTCRSS